jgi:hypothetical protein
VEATQLEERVQHAVDSQLTGRKKGKQPQLASSLIDSAANKIFIYTTLNQHQRNWIDQLGVL